MASNMLNIIFVLWIFILSCQDSYSSFTGVTDQILGGPLDGLMATFADFDMDKQTDVFVISDNGHMAELYLRGVNGTYLLALNPSSTIQRSNDTITNIAAGDFDGDFQLDVLITTKPNTDPFDKSTPTKAYVYWGNVTTLKFDNYTLVTDQLADQPLVMDYNADMIPDLFGEVMSGQKKFWTRQQNDTRTFREVNLVTREEYHLVVPNSNAFLDLTGNYAANLFMMTNKSGAVTFEIWSYVHVTESAEPHNVWQFTQEYPPPQPPQDMNIEHLGVSTFADMNADSNLDHVLPVCYDATCSKGAIYVNYYGSDDWTLIFHLSELDFEEQEWGFVPPTTTLTDYTALPLMAHTGDFNLDTLGDLIILVQATVKGVNQRRIVVLKNNGESLEAVWTSEPAIGISSPIVAAFIDIQRTGQLDILIVNQTVEGIAQMLLMDNTLAMDAYFVKIEVLSGLCSKSDCPGEGSGNTPYGINQPGPTVRYSTTGSTGKAQRDGGTQLSQSAYFSLQLPYVLLGLGQNPNFVDTLTVGVPAATVPDKKSKRVDEWKSVIPNSQLIVIPDPLDNPSDWISKILIIPGQSVLLTGIVLISTGVILALTAALLHLKERKDDEKEKRQAAHQFHFDAM